ncbi:MAG TPA: hypothetical protein VEH86_02290 [Candidatus Acidoferrum sp.]|nr:hypothetical protein [Candidatus Acidoferrum sp.]
MSSDLSRILVSDFLEKSWACVEAIVGELATFKGEKRVDAPLFCFKDGRRVDVKVSGSHFFLRSSVEYSNPQLTVEEVQGIIAARLLEVCSNYFHQYGLHKPDEKDIGSLCEILKKPSEGPVVAFLLNTDDIEPDRYSMNPLKESIVTSGQSAFPTANVKTESLLIDQKFVQKYEGMLISKREIEQIGRHLQSCGNSYMSMVDAVKYEDLHNLSESFGIDLNLYSMRLPLTMLAEEKTEGLLHYVIRQTHTGYESVECVYRCMGRSMKNLTTLLTVPHSAKGYGSKRAARGRIYFEGAKLKSVKVDYRTVLLYPNAMDPSDVSVAQADDNFAVDGEKLGSYHYAETPSSPQFFLYSLASPEDAVLWHGIGAFGASELLKSYTTTRMACAKDLVVKGLSEKYGIATKVPLQFNLDPKFMWGHPVHHNIDASIGCVEDLKSLTSFGMRLERLPIEQYIRK